jgi:hypothetical protein
MALQMALFEILPLLVGPFAGAVEMKPGTGGGDGGSRTCYNQPLNDKNPERLTRKRSSCRPINLLSLLK